MDEDLEEAVKALTMEFHRERFGRSGLLVFKGINMLHSGKIQVLYEVGRQLFEIDIQIGLPGQSQ